MAQHQQCLFLIERGYTEFFSQVFLIPADNGKMAGKSGKNRMGNKMRKNGEWEKILSFTGEKSLDQAVIFLYNVIYKPS
jgi:hypothetical protein